MMMNSYNIPVNWSDDLIKESIVRFWVLSYGISSIDERLIKKYRGLQELDDNNPIQRDTLPSRCSKLSVKRLNTFSSTVIVIADRILSGYVIEPLYNPKNRLHPFGTRISSKFIGHLIGNDCTGVFRTVTANLLHRISDYEDGKSTLFTIERSQADCSNIKSAKAIAGVQRKVLEYFEIRTDELNDVVLCRLLSTLKKVRVLDIYKTDIAYQRVEHKILLNNKIKKLKSSSHVDKWVTRDDYGRVHHNGLGINSFVRRYVRFGYDDSIYTIDLANSQLVFLIDLYKRVDDHPSYSKLFEEVYGGRGYDYIANLMGADFNSRGELKEFMFKKVLFGRNLHSANDNRYKKFKELFPVLVDFIESMKRRDHSNLPKQLQTLESSIFINNVLEGHWDENRYNEVLPLHDGYLCTERASKDLFQRLTEAFRENDISGTLVITNLLTGESSRMYLSNHDNL